MGITFYQNNIFSSNILWIKPTHYSFILHLLIPSNWPILDFFDNFVDNFRDKFALHLQICSKFVSHLLWNSLCFRIYFFKFASIPFRKLLAPFNSFQICFRSELLHLKIKRNFATIPRKALKFVKDRLKMTIVGREFDFQGRLKGWCTHPF